jgi:NAD(P)-dependent dehydrogenase (short-subunit alcohol dehydrogenase family)
MINEASVRTALVTGGTDGIGKEIAWCLVGQGIRVLIVGRDTQKGARTEAEFRQSVPNADVRFLQADLSLMRETHRLADEVGSLVTKLYYLVLCAGIVQGQRIETPEGIESNFAVNYLSRFVLTGRLMQLLKTAGLPDAAARILTIGGAARNGTIHYDDVNLTKRFGILTAVPQFCEANDVFVLEQARRLAAAGQERKVTITGLKVGAVRTNIRRTFPGWMKVMVPLIIDPLLSQTAQQIASSALPLITGERFEGTTGALFMHIKRFKQITPGKRTAAPQEGRKLWEFSEGLATCALNVAPSLPHNGSTP